MIWIDFQRFMICFMCCYDIQNPSSSHCLLLSIRQIEFIMASIWISWIDMDVLHSSWSWLSTIFLRKNHCHLTSCLLRLTDPYIIIELTYHQWVVSLYSIVIMIKWIQFRTKVKTVCILHVWIDQFKVFFRLYDCIIFALKWIQRNKKQHSFRNKQKRNELNFRFSSYFNSKIELENAEKSLSPHTCFCPNRTSSHNELCTVIIQWDQFSRDTVKSMISP